MITRRQALTGVATLAASSVALGLLNQSPQSIQTKKRKPTYLDGAEYFTNFELTNHLGEKFNFYDDLIKDKFVVINMMYAQCSEGVCPISTMNLKKVHEKLADRVGGDIHFYSISLAANHDSPRVLKKYTEDNGIGTGWQFLTGNYDEIEIIRRRLGFFDHDPIVDKDRTQHAGMVRIGSDHYKRWMMAPALGSHRSILQVINHAYRAPNSIV